MNRRLFSSFALALVSAGAGFAVPPPAAPLVPAAALETISDDEARLELARVLAYAKNYDESLAEYRRVLEARPSDQALRVEYGQVQGWAGRHAEAVATLSAVPAEKLTPAAAVLLADLGLGDKKFAEAVALYRRALAAEPSDALTRFKLARVLSWEKHYEASFAEYKTLLAAAPDDIQVRRHYAQVLGWAGRLEESAAEWRRTLSAEAP